MSTNGFLIHEARRKGRGRRFFTREKRKKKGNGGCFFFCSILWRQHSSEFPLAIPHYFFLPFSTEKVDWGGNKFILGSDGRINGSKSGRKMALLGTNLSFLLILQKKSQFAVGQCPIELNVLSSGISGDNEIPRHFRNCIRGPRLAAFIPSSFGLSQ